MYMERFINDRKELIKECLDMCDTLEKYACFKSIDEAKRIAKELVLLEQKVIDMKQEAGETMTEKDWFVEITERRVRPVVHYFEGIAMDFNDELRLYDNIKESNNLEYGI